MSEASQLVSGSCELTRTATRYEEKVADLKRQIDSLQASQGAGPAIPNLIPASTNHFGSLMGYPHGMFGQAVPAASAPLSAGPGGGIERANGPTTGASNGLPPMHAPSRGAADDREAGPGRDAEMKDARQERHRDYTPTAPPPVGSRGHVASNDMAVDRPLSLGKRSRPGMSVDERERYNERDSAYDGPLPASRTRTIEAEGKMLENGSAQGPQRPPSRTWAQSPANAASPAQYQALQAQRHAQNHTPDQMQHHHGYPTHDHRAAASRSFGTAASAPNDEAARHASQQPASAREARDAAATASSRKHDEQPPLPPWDVVYAKGRRPLEVNLISSHSHDSVVCCVRISPDGKLLATGSNRVTTLYETKERGKRVAALSDEVPGRPAPDNYIRSVAFSPDGRLLATGSEDRIIRIWNVTNLAARQVPRKLVGHKSEIYSLAFTPDGTRLVSGSGDNSVRVWSIESGVTLMELKVDDICYKADGTPTDTGITSVAVSPDGLFLAAGSLDYLVRVWDLNTGRLLEKLKGHLESVYSLAFVPDDEGASNRLLTGSLDQSIRVWDLQALRILVAKGEIRDPGKPTSKCIQSLLGHKDYVLSVACSPDGRWVVSGSKDRAVQVWNLRTGQAQLSLHGHKNSVISTAVSDQGDLLATGGGDWSAKLFRISGMGDATHPPASNAQSAPQSLPKAPGVGPIANRPPGNISLAGARSDSARTQAQAAAAATGTSTPLANIAMAAVARQSASAQPPMNNGTHPDAPASATSERQNASALAGPGKDADSATQPRRVSNGAPVSSGAKDTLNGSETPQGSGAEASNAPALAPTGAEAQIENGASDPAATAQQKKADAAQAGSSAGVDGAPSSSAAPEVGTGQ